MAPPFHHHLSPSPLSVPISSQGYALVEYETRQEAQAAIDHLDGAELLTLPIAVNWAFCTGPRRGAAGGGGAGR